MADTKIEWADTVWNPMTGCSRVSAGCANCYMFELYPRLKAMGVPGYEREPNQVTFMTERVIQPYYWKKPRRVFVNSMSDLFEERVPFAFIDSVFKAMRETPQHRYMVLTKRPERATAWWRLQDVGQGWAKNVWMGVSVESQQYASRIEYLAPIAGAVKFVSAEPLIGELTLADYMHRRLFDWLIVGGESGNHVDKLRPMELDWARRLRDECEEYGIPFFLKQLGRQKGIAGGKRGHDLALLDGRLHRAEPAL